MAVTRDWLSSIYEISKIINATLELGDILDVIAREVRRLIEFDRLVLGLLDDAGESLRLLVPVAHPDTVRPSGTLIGLDGHVLGEVVRSRQVLAIPDLRAESRFPGDHALVEEGVISCIALPLASAQKVLGAMAFARSQPRPFTDTESELLRSVAEQTASAVEHAKLFAAERKRANHLAIINQVARRAFGTFDLDTLLQETASLIQQQFAYYDVSIFLVDRQTNEVVLRAQAGAYKAASAIGYRQPLGVGMVGWAASTGTTLLANDVARDPHYIMAFEGEQASRSELVVPIKLAGQVAGVINIECTELGAFDSIDATSIETLADQLAHAIESVRLVAEMRYLKELDENILASIPSSILVLDRGQRIVSANDTACRVLERPLDQLVGQDLRTFIGLDGPAAAAMQRVIESVIDSDQRLWLPAERVRLPNGLERIVDIYLSPMARRGGAGDAPQRHAIVCISDVTERRLAEEALLREKQKLDDIVSAMGAGVALIDRELNIVWSNKTLNQWFGGGRSVVGQKCHLIHANPASPCPDCRAEAAFATGEAHADIRLHRDTPLGTRHFQHIFAPVRDHTGNVTQVIMLAFDVTEHARSLEQIALLQKLSQVMQGVVELDRLLHLILTCVTAGPGLGFNRAILLLVNDERTHLEGRLGVGPASHEEAARIWRELSQRAQTLDDLLKLFDEPRQPTDTAMRYLARQIRIPLSDTSQVPVQALNKQRPIVVADADADPGVTPQLRSLLWAKQFVCVPLIARDAALGVIIADNVFTGHPIGAREVEMLQTFASHAGLAISAATAYKRLEEKLDELEETRDRLVRSERLAVVGRLAAHVAHEIRNPLATIGGFARAALRAPGDSPKVERNTRIIIEEVERLEQILANVMNFTRPGSPVPRERDINESVEALCAFHEHLFAERKIVVRKSLDPNCPILRFDPEQIRQVLLNLCQNAIDSMPRGGELTVMTRALEDHVEVVIADTGHGMTESVMENIFQPFFTTKPGGTGLGLSVCQKIIQDHGGDIEVNSKPGAGSSFTISLPIPGRQPA